jgi:hypothetical protein
LREGQASNGVRSPLNREPRLRVGDWVEVRSKHEILGTLDVSGQLDHLPFMPQMFRFCGQRFRVVKRAHKLCDTVNSTGGRAMDSAVHLEGLRCDGQAYGGCEMGCLIYWKEAWLTRVDGPVSSSPDSVKSSELTEARTTKNVCTEEAVSAATQAPRDTRGSSEPVYVCQATQLPYASRRLPIWSLGQYLDDYRSGNASLSEMLGTFASLFYVTLAEAGVGFGTPLRFLYDTFQKLQGRWSYPGRPGMVPTGSRTPSLKLDLRPGELVRIRDHHEILATIDSEFRNRGMAFHPEMVPYCGRTFRVSRRVRRIINEKTGHIMELKNDCLVLEGADCVGRYTKPLFCPRACYPYWREIWLDRVSEVATPKPFGA